MTIYTGDADVRPLQGVTSLDSSRGEELGAEAGETFASSPLNELFSLDTLRGAEGLVAPLQAAGAAEAGASEFYSQIQADQQSAPDVPIDQARAQVKAAGVSINLPDQPTIKQPALDMMLDDAKAERQRQVTIARGPTGIIQGALDVGTSLMVGAVDPLNLAAFSIPVLGEARYAKLMASAGDSVLARAGVRAGIGAAQGAVGSTILSPIEDFAKTAEGQDYTFADALRSMMYGAGLGAVFHAVPAGLRDAWRSSRGLPLEGTHVSGSMLDPAGVTAQDLQDEFNGAPPGPDSIAADLPPRAKEDTLHAATAALIEDKPVQSAEIVQAAAQADPAIAQALEGVTAYHGSPYDFDAFDSGKIGEGEGAQSYGHGLYFAENEAVARDYADRLGGRDSIDEDPTVIAGDLLKEAGGDRQAALGLVERDVAARKVIAEKNNFTSSFADEDAAFFTEVRKAIAEGREREGAVTYKVHIAANRNQFLDWDMPIGEQSDHVRNALLNHPDPMIAGTAAKHGAVSGKDFYQRAEQRLRVQADDFPAPDEIDQTRPRLARLLSEAGIPGIKYLDQGSRDSGLQFENVSTPNGKFELRKGRPGDDYWDMKVLGTFDNRAEANAARDAELAKLPQPTSNFVVFDDKLIRITHKNGKEIGLDQVPRTESVVNHSLSGGEQPFDPEQTWQNLAAAKSHDDEPEQVEASRAADQLPPPASITEHEPENGIAGPVARAPVQLPANGGNVARLPGKPTSGPRARPEATRSLLEHLAANGGLREDDPLIPDVRSSLGRDNRFVPGFGNLIRKPKEVSTAASRGGVRAPMSLDQARESAVEAGYLEDHGEHTGGVTTSSVNDLLEAIDREDNGNRVYRQGTEPPRSARDEAQHQNGLGNALDKALGDADIEPASVGGKLRDRVLEIMDREHVADPLEAYERAVMEETEHGAQAGEHERVAEEIPGWDVSDDAGAAPDASQAAQGRGQDRAGEASRAAGEGDRAAPGEEPAAGGLTKQSPVEKAAAEAEAQWRALEPTLSDEERAAFNDILQKIDQDRDAQAEVIRQGAACLAEAVA